MVPPTPAQNKVIFVPVPMPAYEENDSIYRPLGEYNPNPLSYTAPEANAPSYNTDTIPVPTPESGLDNDWESREY